MTETISILDELYRYNHWANWKVLELCDGLTDSQLDQPREIGFGTLRNTIFHILAAEEVWLERWSQIPPRPFPLDADGMSIQELGRRLDSVNERRAEWLESIGERGLRETCTYQDSRGTAYTNQIHELLIHVSNHGIHHRSQALSYLKSFGRTIRGGLDHLFFRFANPAISQTTEAVEAMKQFGLECGTGVSPAVGWDKSLIERYFAYGDWATDRLFELTRSLDETALHHDFRMGMGSIRKTLLHLFDAEYFWTKNWTTGKSDFSHLPPSTTAEELTLRWKEMRRERDQFLASQNEHSVSKILLASFGGPPFQVATTESMIQVCGHGTHHRAQLANMLRHSGQSVPGIDYVVWVREE